MENINNEIKGITKPNEDSLLEKKSKKLTLKDSSKVGNTSKNHLRQSDKSRHIRESASNTSNSYGDFIKKVNNLSPNNLSRGKIDSKKNRESLTLFIGSGDYGLDHYLKNTENNTQNIDTKDRKPKLYEKNKGEDSTWQLIPCVSSKSDKRKDKTSFVLDSPISWNSFLSSSATS